MLSWSRSGNSFLPSPQSICCLTFSLAILCRKSFGHKRYHKSCRLWPCSGSVFTASLYRICLHSLASAYRWNSFCSLCFCFLCCCGNCQYNICGCQVSCSGSFAPITCIWFCSWLVLITLNNGAWVESILDCKIDNLWFFFFFSFLLDMWAMGAIMAELLTLRPLFPGSRYICEAAFVASFLKLEECFHICFVNYFAFI